MDLDIRLQPKQRALMQLCRRSPASWLGYGGALGGGKSGAIRYLQLTRRFENAGTTGLIFRRKRKELAENHIEPMLREFPQLRQFWREQKRQLVLPNGSNLIFGHGEYERDIEDFLGNEYMDVCVDQAEALTEKSLLLLNSRARWPGKPDATCKTVLCFNPGGPGSAFLQRIFSTKQYRSNEKATDYEFIHAFGWDNIEWVRSHLAQTGVSPATYYNAWTDEQRFETFTRHSEYGRKLMRMPVGLRNGWLYGRFDSFAGQYFENFDPSRHVRSIGELGVQPWHQRWISIDWGFAHNTAVYWYAKTPTHVAVYDELVVNRTNEDEIARLIAEKSAGQTITRAYLSPDAAAKRGTAKPIKEQLGLALKSHGLPYPVDADNARVSGWRLVYSMLGPAGAEPQLLVSNRCARLIECLPMMSRDVDNPEDCQKFDSNEQGEGGDDAADSLRYGLKSYFGDAAPPMDVQYQEKVQAIEEQRGSELSPTGRHLVAMKFQEDWKKSHGPLRRPVRRH